MPSQITQVLKPREKMYTVPVGPDPSDGREEKRVTYDGRVAVTTYDCFNNSHTYEAIIPYGTTDVLVSTDQWSVLALERLEAWADSSDYTIRYQ